MDAAIIPFDFESHAVRSVMVDGKPWFVAADVCRILEIRNHRDAVSSLDDDEKGVGKADTLGGAQEVNIVSESGLYGLSARSNKPVAKRFWKWVRADLLPALIRDGSYSLPGADRAEMNAKRAYFEALPDRHKDRANAHAEAVRRIEDLVGEGMRVTAAVAQVAEEAGVSVRSLHSYRRTIYMVTVADQAAALAPRWNGARRMLAECHPEALAMFLRLCAGPGRISDCYRRMVDEAAARGWSPIPCERTMRRVAQRLIAPMSKKEAA